MTFNSPWSSYTAQRIPVRGSRDFIAPFWTDFDHRVTGQVIYNQYTNGSILGQASEDINRYFPALNFRANWVFVATWYQVAYYPTDASQTTVQAVLISGGQYSFVLMNYGIIAFTTHGVQAGYDTENSTHHFSIPGSFSNTSSGSNSTFPLSSNVNVTGRWAFRLDGGLSGCTFKPFFSSCVYDLCLYTKANGILCSDVAAYEKTCSVLGLNISDWRSALYCPESDPCEQLDCAEHEWCGEKDGVYGCFCDEHHHRPNNTSYDSSISCNSSSGTMSVSRCQLFEVGFHPGALHLQDHSCNGTVEDGRLVFHFNNDDKLCGTTLRSNGTHFTYENLIQGDVDTHGGLISRQKNIHLHFCCEYPLWQALSMDVGINPVESIVRKKLPSGQGRYHVRMIPYQDSSFRYPMTTNRNLDMEIDQRLYVELRTEGVDGRQISTVVESCWATPINVAGYPVRWDLIKEMCPNPADTTVEIVQNGVSTVSRFSFRMFTFTNFTSIYLHCHISLCLKALNNCTPHCFPGHHHRSRRDISLHGFEQISLGPLFLPQDKLVRVVRSMSAAGQVTPLLTPLVTLLVGLLTAITLVYI